LVAFGVVLFAVGLGVTAYAGNRVLEDAEPEDIHANRTAPRSNMRRTMELQVSMHGDYWKNRSSLVADFFAVTMDGWGIGYDDDSFMRLDKDETCIMMYVHTRYNAQLMALVQ
jgi:hypothetical protein